MHAIARRTEPVLVVSPDLRSSVLAVTRALQSAGLLRGFVTGLALPPAGAGLPQALGGAALRRAFRSRVLPGWLQAPADLLWAQELVHQGARRAGLPERWTHELWRYSEPAFDRRVARRWAGRVPCLYGMENACVESFEAQRERGGLNVLWQVIAHPHTLRRVEQELAREYPEAGNAHARAQQRDAAWVLERKRRQHAAAHLIVCNSRFVYDSFLAAGIAARKLACVPTPCPAPTDPAPPTPQRAPRILLFAGHLSLRKGVLDLLQAFRLLEAGPEVELWLAGKNLLPESLLSGLPAGVRRLGQVPQAELQQLMRRASLFVLPTRAEGRSHAVLEAVAAGLPTITTHESGCGDLVVDGETGFLVPASDPAALAARLRECLARPELLSRMAGRCLERARAWDERAFERAHTGALRPLLQGHPGIDQGAGARPNAPPRR